MKNRLIFNAFFMCAPTHVLPGLWRSPGACRTEMNDIKFWIDLVKVLEKAKFDTLFSGDVLALGANFGGNTDVQVREGVAFPANDPSILMSALIPATADLGLVFTSSVLQAHPYELARRMATMDHFSKGRVGWNVVTSFSERAFFNFGFDGMLDHDQRYIWGQEYMDVVYKLWEGSWADDALLFDTDRNVVTDPSKVHEINHIGARYKVNGPNMCSPSPQRTPVLFQAGSSPAGRAFCARHAEGMFLYTAGRKAAEEIIKDTRARALAFGRRPDDLLFCQGLMFVIGSTEAEAKQRDREYDDYLNLEAELVTQGNILGVDLGGLPLSTPLSEIAKEAHGLRGIMDSIIASAPSNAVPTLADLAKMNSRTARVVGTPEQIVDELLKWVDIGVDGFNVMDLTNPGSYLDFAEQLVPLLQKKGLMQTEYAEGTLREKLFGRGPNLPEYHPARQYRRILA